MADKKLKHTRRIELTLYRIQENEYGENPEPTDESFKVLSKVPAPLYRDYVKAHLDRIDEEIEELAARHPLVKRLNELRELGDNEALQTFYDDNKEGIKEQSQSVIAERKNLDVNHTLRLTQAFVDVNAGFVKDSDKDSVMSEVDSNFWQCQDLEGLTEFIERFRKAIRV